MHHVIFYVLLLEGWVGFQTGSLLAERSAPLVSVLVSFPVLEGPGVYILRKVPPWAVGAGF